MNPRRIADDIQQSRPFRSPAEEAVVALLRTADVVRGRIAAAVQEDGFTLQQYNVLRILRGAGDEGLPTLEIADRMVERTPGITRLLDRLIAKDLVTRERDSQDRRKVYARLTRAGSALVDRLDTPIDAADRAAMAGLSRKELKALTKLLDRLRN